NANFDFMNDPRVILKITATTRTKCLSGCLLKSECYFFTFKNEICQLYNKYALAKKIQANNSLFYSKRSNYYRNGENLNDYFTTTSTTSTTTTTLPPVIISSINNPYGVNSGVWGQLEECDQNDYVVGFRTKLQLAQGAGLSNGNDDTALNGVELICSNSKKIKSSEGQWGSWDPNFRYCSNFRKVVGFSYGIEKKQNNGDDTATNVIRLKCSDSLKISSLEGTWSTSKISLDCPANQNIVGLKTQIEPLCSDNTASNNIEFVCKTIL
ncbi:unnamed protein product, partial [Brachionus calyciflorus]